MTGRQDTREPTARPTAPSLSARDRAGVAAFVVVALGLLAVFLVVGPGVVRLAVLVVAQVGCVLVAAAGLAVGRRLRRPEWALALVALVVGAVGNLAGGPYVDPTPQAHSWLVSSVLSGISGLLLAVAAVRLARREGFAAYASVGVDTAVYAIASLLVWWVAIGRPLVLSPDTATPQAVAAGLLPLTDGVLLVGTGVLLASRVGQSPAPRALLGYCLLGLAADVGAARVAVDHQGTVPAWIPAVWLLQLPCAGLVGLTAHRTAHTPSTLPRTSLLLVLASLATPGIVGMYAASHPLAPCVDSGHVLSGTLSATCAASLANPTSRVGLSMLTVVLVVLGSIVLAALVAVRFRGLLAHLEAQSARLERSARTDELTGLPNRRAGTRILTSALAAARTHPDEPVAARLAVAVIDLDHFKEYNDTHGHQAGDQLLQESARAWAGVLDGATVYRYGGEEFVAVIPGRTLEEAAGVVDGLRAVVPRGQSFSAGVTALRPGDDVSTLIARADAALYESKGAGRARTTTL